MPSRVRQKYVDVVNKQIVWSVCTPTSLHYWPQQWFQMKHPGCLSGAWGSFFLNILKPTITPPSVEILVVFVMSAGCQSSRYKNISGCRGLTTEESVACRTPTEALIWRILSVVVLLGGGNIVSSTAWGVSVCQCQEGSFHLHCDN